jgi:uncharacterized protein
LVRPLKRRYIEKQPNTLYFKPQGIPLRLLEEVTLFPDELEALRLHDLDGLDQTKAAEKMKISQSTFARILARTYNKIAQAIVNGKAIKIESRPSRPS